MSLRVLFLACTALTWGCAAKKTSSANLRTRGLGASFRIEAPGDDRGHAYASLYAGAPNDPAAPLVELEEGDFLTVTSANMETRLREQKNFLTGAPQYLTEFALPAPGGEVVVALSRPSDVSAPRSTCTMPPAFDVVAPMKGAEIAFGRGEITIRWEPAGGPDSMVLSIDSECASLLPTVTTSDTGSITLAQDALKLKAGCSFACRSPTGACDALLRIGKKRAGVVDPAFGQGGTIECVQGRTIPLRMNPGLITPVDGGAD